MTQINQRTRNDRVCASGWSRPGLWLIAFMLGLLLPAGGLRAQEEVLDMLSPITQYGALTVTGWPTGIRTNAALYSWRTNAWDADAGRMVYRLTMQTNFPWQWPSGTTTQRVDSIAVVSVTDWDYLPPEADEIWVRLKAVSGRFLVALGSINLAFAPGDTFTDIHVIDESNSQWQTIRFSLHKHLIRNYRRSSFSKTLPYVSLTRWIQEPLKLYLFRPGAGELLIDRISLVSGGVGGSYPVVAPERITPVVKVADFETTNDLGLAFSFTTVPIDFAGPKPTNYTKTSVNASGSIMVAGKSIQWFLPPRRAWVEQSATTGHALEVTQTGFESFAFTGLRMPRTNAANAVLMTLRADHNSTLTSLVLDFLMHAAPPASADAFPWPTCQTPAAWLEDTNLNFDLYLSEANTAQESYALYHARRAVPNHQWTQVLLPLDDFAGIYASNDGTNLLNGFPPLRATNLVSLGFFSPYRQLKAETRLWIDDVSLVRVDLPSDPLRSFWQNPVAPNAELVALPAYQTYFGHFRERDAALGDVQLNAVRDPLSVALSVAGPPDQRFEIYASDDLLQWQPVVTRYVDPAEDPYRVRASHPARFFKVVSE